jgi:hypothetical protein
VLRKAVRIASDLCPSSLSCNRQLGHLLSRSCLGGKNISLSRVYTMQVVSRETRPGDARADVPCKLWKVRQVEL